MGRAVPALLAVLAFAAFTLEGLAFWSWAAENSPTCRGEPSLDCAGLVVLGALLAPLGGLAAGVAVPVAATAFLGGRRRRGVTVVLLAAGLLAAFHLVQLT
jgi:hypothetical protein